MQLAVIDMGTNTFGLIIAQCSPNGFKVITTAKYPVKLGQKNADVHIIDKNAMSRAEQGLMFFLQEINKQKISTIKALATSSIRTAANKDEFIQNIKQKFNIDIEVIDGNREAELIYLANKYAVKMNDDLHLIMDIGGGSTEFIIANDKKIFWKESFLLGMARLYDEIKPSDPLTTKDILSINNYLNTHLSKLKEQMQNYQPKILVGSSGAFDSLVEMIEAHLNKHISMGTNSVIQINDFYTIYHKLIPLSYSQRLKIDGLIPMRADMINLSFIFIDYVLKSFSLQHIKVSSYSLKEGVVIESCANHLLK